MFETIIITFKLDHDHAHACCVSQSTVKKSFKRGWWFWRRFAPNLLEYIRANNYFTVKRLGKVIAEIKRCSFFCPTVYVLMCRAIKTLRARLCRTLFRNNCSVFIQLANFIYINNGATCGDACNKFSKIFCHLDLAVWQNVHGKAAISSK